MPMNPKHMTAEQLSAPWSAHIAAVNGTYDPPLRGLYVATAGTADLTDISGNTITAVPLVAGSVWPGLITVIANISSAVLYSGR